MSETGMTFTLFGKDVSASKALEAVGKNAEKVGGHFANMGKVAGLAFGATGIGAVIAAGVAIGKFAGDSVDKFGEVGKEVLGLQRVVGGSAEDVSRLASEFTMTGVNAEAGGKAIGILSKHLAANDKTAQSLGFAYRDSAGHIKSMQDILPDLAAKFATMKAGPERTALALQLFGKNGTAMLPFLAKGKDGLKDLAAESDKLGTTLSGKDLQAVKDNTIAKRKWGEAMTGVQLTLGKVLYPILTKVADWMTATLIPVLGNVAKWFSQNLLPAIQNVGNWISTTLIPAIVDLAAGFMENVWPALQSVVGMVVENLQPGLEALAGFWTGTLLPGIKAAMPAFKAVVVVLAAIVGGIVLVASWIIGKLATAFTWVATHIAQNMAPLFKVINSIGSTVLTAVNWVKTHFDTMVTTITGLPGRISTAAAGMWNGISGAFRGMLNMIIGWWNGLSFTLPSVDTHTPLGTIGGFTLSTPHIPYLARGGITTGPTLALIGDNPGGREAVIPLSGPNAMDLGGNRPIVVQLVTPLGKVLTETLVDYRRQRGVGLGLG